MSHTILEVSFLAGTDLVDAVLEAKALAIKLDLAYAKFKFNGKQFSISQNPDVDKCIDTFCTDTDYIIS